jgi:predicted RNA binding protein YcfA (HicA-like mRNA interferase family)
MESDDERRVQAPAAEARLHIEPGKGGHLIVRLADKMAVLPMHGKQKELGTGLVNAIKKDLGLK